MECVAKGMLDKEIAAELEISFSAVRHHAQTIYRKLRVKNRTEAAIKWISGDGKL